MRKKQDTNNSRPDTGKLCATDLSCPNFNLSNLNLTASIWDAAGWHFSDVLLTISVDRGKADRALGRVEARTCAMADIVALS
jgi:hypothetical protein